MTNKVTIDEVKKAKIKLEMAVLKLAQEFEKDYGVRLSYLNLQRAHEDGRDVPSVCEKKGPLENIEANMELDLVY